MQASRPPDASPFRRATGTAASRHELSLDLTNRTGETHLATNDLSALAGYDARLLAQALGDFDTDKIAEGGVRGEPTFARLKRFVAEVESSIDQLMPTWSGGFPIVQVSIDAANRNRTAADPFTYCNPTGAVFMHPDIDSLTGSGSPTPPGQHTVHRRSQRAT